MEKLYMSETEVAERYCISKSWLQRKRWKGCNEIGPPYVKLAVAVRYNIKETDEWFAKRSK